MAGCRLDLPGTRSPVKTAGHGSASRTRPGVTVALSVLALTCIVACADVPATAIGAQPSPTPSIYPLLPELAERSAATTEEEFLSAFVVTASGVVLPDPAVSPGATYPDVTEIDICDLHYTLGVRQPRFSAKVAAFANYGISIRDRDSYQVDKLVPVSLGGSNAIENLWPQPYAGEAGATSKDELERHLRGLVCSGTLTLAAAQEAIASDWSVAHGLYMDLPIDPGSAGPEPWRPPEDSLDPYFVTNQGPCQTEGEIGKRRVGKECRSRWSPYH